MRGPAAWPSDRPGHLTLARAVGRAVPVRWRCCGWGSACIPGAIRRRRVPLPVPGVVLAGFLASTPETRSWRTSSGSASPATTCTRAVSRRSGSVRSSNNLN